MAAPRHSFAGPKPAPSRATGSRQASWAEARARLSELDDLRLTRRLTDEESLEADRITDRLYMRVYRQQQAERWGGRR